MSGKLNHPLVFTSCLFSPIALAQPNFSDSTKLECFLDHARDSFIDLMKL